MGATLAPDFMALAAAGAARDAHVEWAAVVGGYVRSRLMGAEPADLDLVVPHDGPKVASRIAAAIGGRVVPLGRWRQWQVFHPGRRVDVSEADDLERDLARRDFTVNAIAWMVVPPTYEIVDPLNGRIDLASRTLRLCRPDALVADPARLIRGARLVACGFSPDPGMARAATEAAQLVADVPLDRVFRELRRLASAPDVGAAVSFLVQTGALAAWLGREVAVDPTAFLETAATGGGDGIPCEHDGPVGLARRVLSGVHAGRPEWIEMARRLGCTRAEAIAAFRAAQAAADGQT